MAVTGTTGRLVGVRMPVFECQNLLAQLFRITLAVAHKLDHKLGDHLQAEKAVGLRCAPRRLI
jgi:hypothetical protein